MTAKVHATEGKPPTPMHTGEKPPATDDKDHKKRRGTFMKEKIGRTMRYNTPPCCTPLTASASMRRLVNARSSPFAQCAKQAHVREFPAEFIFHFAAI